MKILIDCGTHLGEGMEKMIKHYSIDDTWKIFTFEPNTDSYRQVITKDFGLKNIAFANKAVWITDGTVSFHAETPPNSEKSDGTGSSIVDTKDWSPKNPGNSGVGEFNNTYQVSCINLSKFIKENFLKEDFIVLKLDIEGAEFEVLKDMIDTGSIKYVDELYVEFHEWAMKSKSLLSKYKLILSLLANNWRLKLTVWH